MTPISTQIPVDGSNAASQVGSTYLNVLESASDPVNGNSVALTGRELLVLHNTDSVDRIVTLSSVPDSFGRSNDIASYTVPAGKLSAITFIGAFGQVGFRQVDGTLHLQTNSALLKVAVLQINF